MTSVCRLLAAPERTSSSARSCDVSDPRTKPVVPLYGNSAAIQSSLQLHDQKVALVPFWRNELNGLEMCCVVVSQDTSINKPVNHRFDRGMTRPAILQPPVQVHPNPCFRIGKLRRVGIAERYERQFPPAFCHLCACPAVASPFRVGGPWPLPNKQPDDCLTIRVSSHLSGREAQVHLPMYRP